MNRMNEERIEERIAELKDLQTDHEMALDAIMSELEDLEYDLEMLNETWYYQNEDEYRTDLGDLLVDIARTTGGEI